MNDTGPLSLFCDARGAAHPARITRRSDRSIKLDLADVRREKTKSICAHVTFVFQGDYRPPTRKRPRTERSNVDLSILRLLGRLKSTVRSASYLDGDHPGADEVGQVPALLLVE